VCAVERDAYAASILAQRQNDGHLPPFPIWSDVCSFDGRPWRGIAQVISGGFPCQDISAAGKGVGIGGKRSGLWSEMARIIGEVRPRFVFVENSPLLVSRGLGLVLADLAGMGYDASWGIVGADDAGAPHRRKRIWIRGELADARTLGGSAGFPRSNERQEGNAGFTFDGGRVAWWDQDPADVADAECHRLQGGEPARRTASDLRRRFAQPGESDVADTTGGEDLGRERGIMEIPECGRAGFDASPDVGGEDVGDSYSIDGWTGAGRPNGEEADDASFRPTEPRLGGGFNGLA
jgi:DNA (cytosine-5)-methyltransferase 1